MAGTAVGIMKSSDSGFYSLAKCLQDFLPPLCGPAATGASVQLPLTFWDALWEPFNFVLEALAPSAGTVSPFLSHPCQYSVTTSQIGEMGTASRDWSRSTRCIPQGCQTMLIENRVEAGLRKTGIPSALAKDTGNVGIMDSEILEPIALTNRYGMLCIGQPKSDYSCDFLTSKIFPIVSIL